MPVGDGSRRNKKITESDKERFLEGLRNGMTVTQASNYGGHPHRSFYTLIHRDPDFRAAKEEAYAIGGDVIEAEAIRRGLEGNTKPIIGKVAPGVDGHLKDENGNPMYEVVHSDRILETVLKGRKPQYKDNPRIDINNQTLNLSIEDRSAALADVARVLEQAGVNIGEIVDGEATELSDGGASPHKELPGPSNVLAEPSEL